MLSSPFKYRKIQTNNTAAVDHVPGTEGKPRETKGQFHEGAKGRMKELKGFSISHFLRVYQRNEEAILSRGGNKDV